MIPTMPPISAMPSSTRPTTTFTSTNTKNIASKNPPALQQRQGYSPGTLKGFIPEAFSLSRTLLSHLKAKGGTLPPLTPFAIGSQIYFDSFDRIGEYSITALEDEKRVDRQADIKNIVKKLDHLYQKLAFYSHFLNHDGWYGLNVVKRREYHQNLENQWKRHFTPEELDAALQDFYNQTDAITNGAEEIVQLKLAYLTMKTNLERLLRAYASTKNAGGK
jgi:hypothetical protein